MTTFSQSISPTSVYLRRAIVADAAFWSVAGTVAALASVPVGRLVGVPPLWFAAGAAGLAVVSVGILFGLSRTATVSRRLVWGFAVGNLALAPVLWVAAVLGWLPLSSVGQWGLATCADAMLVLGLYQLYALRRDAA